MITPELISYIKNEISMGTNTVDLNNTLLKTGWSHNQINEAFQAVKQEKTAAPEVNYSRIPEFKTLLKNSTNVLQKQYRRIFLIQLFPAIGIIFSIIFLLLNNLFPQIPKAILYIAYPFIIFGSIMGLLSGPLNQFAIVFENEQININKIFLILRSKNFWKMILLNYFGFLIYILGLLVPFVLILVPGLLSIIIIFSLLWAAIGFIVPLKLSFASYIFMKENCSMGEALKKSWNYTEDNLFTIFKYELSFGFITFAFNLVPVLGNLFQIFILTPLSAIFFYHLYLSLKFQKETAS
ncbi:MAG: hypothetical protein UT63_C0018G0014 [Candidatus Gottesmanbacteria bacterium GW2011_GWC2_39_8]|uniref:DUF975 family protein n=1 Tax=Candidatus Gottesmanbacteria bacterium GW2011_GWC2_39_8 TaxID=1618450 RepID=A0A0G0PZ11_9BACT|nr:MAG: hypothetical protein UT63_C0018G0014 [Candidatus Gottesmanbacteria bacterium GW2011_GWC2_39_8]